MNYECFDDFLSSLQQKKRKKIKSERKKILEKKLCVESYMAIKLE